MASLADVNVLFALLYAGHAHTSQATAWLEREAEESRILLCRVVQMGVLRLLTNARVMQDEVLSPREAWAVWDSLWTDPRFTRVDEPPRLEGAWRALARDLPRGRCAETDVYLAAFALAGGHRLVTFDRGFRRYTDLDCLVL
jgi:hypothetical protein